MALRTSGIGGLDSQLGGGIPPGSTLVLLSEPTNALPLFLAQFCAGGLSIGEVVHYFSFEGPSREVLDRLLGLSRSPPGSSRIRIYDGYAPRFGRTTDRALPEGVLLQPLRREEAFSTILKEVQSTGFDGPYRIAVDTLSALLEPEGEKEALEFLRTLVFLGRETGGIHLVGVIKGIHSPRFETHLRHVATGVMELGVEKKGSAVFPFLHISKLLGVPDPSKIIPFRESEKGIWLEPTKRVF